MEQTAVEWFDRWFRDNSEATHEEGNKALKQAKQMEKEQMIEFAEQYNMYLLKCKKGVRGSVVEMDAEQYYNDTLKNNYHIK